MNALKKSKYILPFVVALAAPFYFKLMCQNLSWLTTDTGHQMFLSIMITVVIGGLGTLLLANAEYP